MAFRKREKKHLFPLGQVVATPAALEVLRQCNGVSITELVERHVTGDWGNVSEDDAAGNDDAVKYGERIHSVYCYGGQDLWVITEADRSVTTLLLPEDY